MGADMIDRRALVLGGLAVAAWPVSARAAGPIARATIVDLPVGSRSTKLFVWAPAKPRGGALFSHGHGSWPERYATVVSALNADGWAVLAPVHVDSMRYPERDKFTLQQGFPERLADMAAVSAYARKGFRDLPVVAVGHSFGTLTALCLGGALAGLGPFRDPTVRAVLGFSTPGRVPGLIGPDAYATVATPLMIVTGTEDRVPGFVTNPADHLFPTEMSHGDRYSLVLAQGGHDLIGGAGGQLTRATPAARLFLDGYGLGKARSRAALARWTASRGDMFDARKAKE